MTGLREFFAPSARTGPVDALLAAVAIALIGFGVVMVYSASSMVAMKRFGSHTYFLNRQVVHVLIAILALICCRYVPYSVYRTLAYPILGLAFILLVALYFPGIGRTVGGAKRWLRFSRFGLNGCLRVSSRPSTPSMILRS